MKQTTGPTRAMIRLAILALGLAGIVTTEVAISNGFLARLMSGHGEPLGVVLHAWVWATLTMAVLNMLSNSVQQRPRQLYGAGASLALALVAGVEASRVVGALGIDTTYIVGLLGGVTFVYCAIRSVSHQLSFAGPIAHGVAIGGATAVAVGGIIPLIGKNQWSLTDSIVWLPMMRAAVIMLVATGIFVAIAFVPGIKLDRSSAWRSLKLRIPMALNSKADYVTFGIALFLLVADLPFALLQAGYPDLFPGAFSTTWLGIGILSMTDLWWVQKEHHHGTATARLAPAPARRFLRRHFTERQAWAATVGIKTSNFTIDHDPGGDLHQNLPASIVQIRAEEINRCVRDVLSRNLLHSQSVGHRVFGALDAEQSIRCCIDTLRMFSCLYLDAGPLVERRIKGLISLLPIVDPGLAEVIENSNFNRLISRNLWFFHFNYNWIDQHLIQSPMQMRYDVSIGPVASRARHSMMDHLKRTGGVGNFVWLGPMARERLLREAPVMKNIIEACPIPDAGGKDEEMLMFIIKFEQLIPRLQRYYDLDSMRRVLLDFEPSNQSHSMQRLIRMQIQKADSLEALREVLTTITSIPWRGFKEKDNALQLILEVFSQVQLRHPAGTHISRANDPKFMSIHRRILEAVQQIGYPSQVLHHAQIDKLALRNSDVLQQVATDPGHPRFAEAWLLIATADRSRLTMNETENLLNLLESLPINTSLRRLPLVQAKAIDALTGITGILDAEVLAEGAVSDEFARVQRIFSRFAVWFDEEGAEADLTCLLVDSADFVAAGKIDRMFDPEATMAIGRILERMVAELGPEHPKTIALRSRWRRQAGASQHTHQPGAFGAA